MTTSNLKIKKEGYFKPNVTCINTVKIMTKGVVVTNIDRGPTVSPSSICTIEKAMAPRRPPYAIMNCSCMLIFLTRSLFASHVSRNTPTQDLSNSWLQSSDCDILTYGTRWSTKCVAGLHRNILTA